MLSPPTDRLHKFLAIGGLALLVSSITVSLQKYEDAEIQRTETYAKLQEVQFTYSHYADHVNRMIGIRNEAISRGLKGQALAEAQEKVQALNPEAEKLGRETERVLVEMTRLVELTVQMQWMKKIWIGLGIFGSLIGIAMTYIGFRQWIRLPENER